MLETPPLRATSRPFAPSAPAGVTNLADLPSSATTTPVKAASFQVHVAPVRPEPVTVTLVKPAVSPVEGFRESKDSASAAPAGAASAINIIFANMNAAQTQEAERIAVETNALNILVD